MVTKWQNRQWLEAQPFDYDSLDESPAERIDEAFWQDVGALFFEVLEFLTAPKRTVVIGQRTKALVLELRPGLIDEDSLLKISKRCRNGVTRQALCHALIKWQSKYGVHRGAFQKAAHLRETSRRSAIAAHRNNGNIGQACRDSLIAELNAQLVSITDEINRHRQAEQARREWNARGGRALTGTEAAKEKARQAAQARWMTARKESISDVATLRS
jgi:hypothetical protein